MVIHSLAVLREGPCVLFVRARVEVGGGGQDAHPKPFTSLVPYAPAAASAPHRGPGPEALQRGPRGDG